MEGEPAPPRGTRTAQAILRAVLEPVLASRSVARRRQSRLLATFLCVLFVVFGLVDLHGVLRVPGYEIPWYGYLWLTAAWLLLRADHYAAAAALALAMFPVVLLTIVAKGTAAPAINLAYLALGVQLAGILLPVRGTLLFAGVTLLALLYAPRLEREQLAGDSLVHPLALVTASAGLAVISILHRDRLERDRQAERESLIRELETKNTELEGLSYTVSHDLKSPLITIRGFLGILSKDLADGRYDRMRGDLERIAGAADSMERLLNELLKLSRVGRVVNPSERVPLGSVVRDAEQMLRSQLEQARVRLVVDEPLPEVYGDRMRLVEVVQNLLENAAKFRGEEADRWIRIGTRPPGDAGGPVVFVADNGIGIDPRHQEKVFGLFHRLDPKAGGSGVGLALVRRIVDVHGGRVWIESEGHGRGTAVCFTLPPPPAD